jgi:hypothetical protein
MNLAKTLLVLLFLASTAASADDLGTIICRGPFNVSAITTRFPSGGSSTRLGLYAHAATAGVSPDNLPEGTCGLTRGVIEGPGSDMVLAYPVEDTLGMLGATAIYGCAGDRACRVSFRINAHDGRSFGVDAQPVSVHRLALGTPPESAPRFAPDRNPGPAENVLPGKPQNSQVKPLDRPEIPRPR